jgi:hypothetical protein
MATNANINIFNNQTLFEETVAFKWKADTTILDLIPFKAEDNKLLTPQNHAGDTVYARRPSWVQSTVLSNPSVGSQNPNDADFVDESLANGTYAPANIQPTKQIKVPITVAHEIRADVEVSAQRLSQSLTREQIEEEFLEPLFTQAKEQIQVYVTNDLFNAAGNTLTLASGTNYAAQLGTTLGYAKSLMVQRFGTTSLAKKVAVFHPDVYPQWFGGAATDYNIGLMPREQQAGGGFEKDIAGFKVVEAATLQPFTIPAQFTETAGVSAVTVAAPGGGVTNGLTSWANTWQINLAGLGNAYVLPQGVRLGFSQPGTTNTTGNTINWTRPTTAADLGKQATFVVTSTVTATAGGTATVTLAGPLIYGTGGQANVNITTAVPTGANVYIVGAATGTTTLVRPIIAFDPNSVRGVSPKWDVPVGTPYSRNFRVGGSGGAGFNFTLLIDRFPGTGQTVMSLRGLFGVGQVREEGFTTIYGA